LVGHRAARSSATQNEQQGRFHRYPGGHEFYARRSFPAAQVSVVTVCRVRAGADRGNLYVVPMRVVVIVGNRGQRQPYLADRAWNSVRHIEMDRAAGDNAGTFGSDIAALDADAVVDFICFTPASAQQLVDALRPRQTLLLHCGTMWVHGERGGVREAGSGVTEDAPRHPFGDYGIKKAAIEQLLLDATRRGDARAVVLHPGHLVGPGWKPVNPAGHFNPEVFRRVARGETLVLPDDGMATVHHVHADDVAQAFE